VTHSSEIASGTATEPMPTSVPRGRRVLIVTVQFPPWGGGGVLRVTKLAKYLDVLGWGVAVTCSDELHPEIVDETLAGQLPASVIVSRIRGPFRAAGGAAKVISVRGSRSGVLSAFVGAAKSIVRAFLIPDRWIGWAIKVGRRAPSSPAPDVVISSGPPHSAHIGASLLARRLRIPHVVDLRDEWGKNPLHHHPAPWHGFVDRRLERWCLRRAAHVVCAAELSPGALARRYPELEGRISTIANGYDPADLVGLEPRAAAPADRPVRFIFAGSLRSTQTVGVFFEVFGALCEQDQTAMRLHLLGLISPHHRGIAEAGVPHWAISFNDPQPHLDALRTMSESDVLVVFTGGGGWGEGTMTGKLYEYLALHRPILVIGPAGPATELVRVAGAGVAAEADDTAGIALAIGESMRMARDPGFVGAAPAVYERFDRRRLAEEWADLLSRVLNRDSVER
jgi:glycosyltransferase involved in cell wall biosynthesis